MLLKDKFIFIVEDNPQNRLVFSMTLAVAGAKMEFERFGINAVQTLRPLRHVDLIILDLMLHNGVSGYDIFQQIRALPQYDTIPIIAISAAEPAIAIPKTRELGFNGFIAKPVDDDLIVGQIVSILGGKPVWYAGGLYL